MFRIPHVSIACALVVTAGVSPLTVSAQVPAELPDVTGPGRAATTLWTDAFGGGGITGFASGFGVTLGLGPVAIIGRYGKTHASGAREETYRQYLGGLVGYRGFRNGHAFTLAAGAGTAEMWREEDSTCGGGWFGGTWSCLRRTGDTGPTRALLLESSWYPAPNGGPVVWGLRVTGAVSEATTTASAVIVLGVGKTP